MSDWYPAGLEDDMRPRLFAAADRGEPIVLVTIVAADGGGPRGVGAHFPDHIGQGLEGSGAGGTSGADDRAARIAGLGWGEFAGAVESAASTVEDIVAELARTRTSERENRLIDSTSDSSMESKKKQGYF